MLASASALLSASCEPKKKTSIVLWIATDIARSAWQSIEVTANGTGGRNGPSALYPSRMFTSVDRNGEARPIPGSIVLIADDDSSNVEVIVSFTPRGTTNGTPFSTKARARFVRNEWRQLEVFLANQCTDESVRRQCEERSRAEGVEYTCGAARIDPCIRVDRAELSVFNPNDPPPDVVTTDASMGDGGVAMDADASTDSAADVSTNDASDSDGPRETIAAPTLVWPPSGARISGNTPRLFVQMPSNCNGATEIEMVACSSVGATNTCSITVGRTTIPAPVPCADAMVRVTSLSFPRTGNVRWGAVLRRTGASPLASPTAVRAIYINSARRANASAFLGAIPDIDNDGKGDVITRSNGTMTDQLEVAHSARYNENPLVATLQGIGPAGGSPIVSASIATQIRVLGPLGRSLAPTVLLGDPAFPSLGGVVLFGEATNTGATWRIDTASGTPSAQGPSVGFGAEVTAAADFNGDGHADFAAGYPDTSTVASTDVCFGPLESRACAATARISPLNTVTHFATSIAGGCDLDDDGFSDLVVVSDQRSPQTSRVSIYYGGTTFPSRPQVEFLVSDVGLRRVGNPQAVTCSGDFDADGYADIALGGSDLTGSVGRVVVLRGSAARAAPTVLVTIDDTATPRGIGNVVEYVGDFAGFAGDDLALGAPSFAGRGTVQVLRFDGSSSVISQFPSIPFSTIANGRRIGASIAALGPIGPNGELGFVVGIPGGGSSTPAHPGSTALVYNRGGSLTVFEAQSPASAPAGSGFGSRLAQ